MATGICLSIINLLRNVDGLSSPSFDVTFRKTFVLSGIQTIAAKDVSSSTTKAPNNAGIYLSGTDGDVSGVVTYTIPGGSILAMYFNPWMVRLAMFTEEETIKENFVGRVKDGSNRVTASFAVDSDVYLYEFQGTSEPIKSASGKSISALVTLCNIAVTRTDPTTATTAIGSPTTQPTDSSSSFPFVAFCATCKRNMLLLPAAPNPSYLNSPWRLEKLQETLEAYLEMLKDTPVSAPPSEGEISMPIFEPIFRQEPIPILRQPITIIPDIPYNTIPRPSSPAGKVSTAALTLDNHFGKGVLPDPLFDLKVLPPCVCAGTSAIFPPADIPSMSSLYNNGGLFSGLASSWVCGAVGYTMPGDDRTLVVSFGRSGCKMLVVGTLDRITAETMEQVERDGGNEVQEQFELDGTSYAYKASVSWEPEDSEDAWSVQGYVTLEMI